MTPHATHPDNGAVPTAPEVRTQLSAILASRAFSRSRRQSSFLSYLVEAALDGRQAEINEYSIARIYDRPESFDPAADSTVRVEARRLRARLAGYYEEEGREARVVIALPVGSYVPEFQYSQPAHPPAAPESAAEPQPARAAENRASRPFGKLALLGGASLIAVLAAFLMWRQPERGVRETRQITSFPGLQMQPALSPDRQQIAFVWDGPGGDNFDIYVKATWNHDLLRLTHDDARDQSPAWSRDGRSIAFLRALPGQRQAVMVIPAAGGTERSVATIQTGVAGIAWSADGNYLIVSDSPAGVSLGLFRVSVATGQMNPLTGYKGDFHPSLSANGKTLVFVRLDSGQPTATLCLLPVTADGLAAGPVEVLDLPQANEPMAGHDGPRFPRRETVGTPNWSSRGDALLFTRYTNDGNLISRFFPGRRHMEDLSELGLNASGLVEYASGHYVYTRRRI